MRRNTLYTSSGSYEVPFRLEELLNVVSLDRQQSRPPSDSVAWPDESARRTSKLSVDADPIGRDEQSVMRNWQPGHRAQFARQTVPFFDLPFEVRSIVYKLLLLAGGELNPSNYVHGMMALWPLEIGFLRVSKQINIKASEIFYKSNLFALTRPVCRVCAFGELSRWSFNDSLRHIALRSWESQLLNNCVPEVDGIAAL